ncbi:unnamed protein product [Effrenium voratum]|nr:unnamed protein product [Effrenium voratum]
MLCLGLSLLLATMGRIAWWELRSDVLHFLGGFEKVLARFDLTPDFIYERLTSALRFLTATLLAHGLLVLLFLVATLLLTSWWMLWLPLLILLDSSYAAAALQVSKVRFAHHVEKKATGSWEGWLLVHGGLDYMSPFVGGTGPTIIALVHWFLDDDAAWCNGLRSPAVREKLGRLGTLIQVRKLFLCEALVASWPRSWRLGSPFTFAAVPAESMVRDWRSKVKGAQGEKGGRAELQNHVPGGRDVPDGSVG